MAPVQNHCTGYPVSRRVWRLVGVWASPEPCPGRDPGCAVGRAVPGRCRAPRASGPHGRLQQCCVPETVRTHRLVFGCVVQYSKHMAELLNLRWGVPAKGAANDYRQATVAAFFWHNCDSLQRLFPFRLQCSLTRLFQISTDGGSVQSLVI